MLEDKYGELVNVRTRPGVRSAHIVLLIPSLPFDSLYN